MTRNYMIDAAVRAVIFPPCFTVLARIGDDWVVGWVRACDVEVKARAKFKAMVAA